MKKYILASSVIALSLLAATPALAESKAGIDVGIGVRLAPIVRLFDKDAYKNWGPYNTNSVGSASVSAGKVQSVNGSSFVVSRSGKATTTVVTNSSTLFKVNGVATTSAALSAGSRVIVIGTTTATSTSGNTIEASLVLIFSKFAGFCKHLMHLK